MFHDEAHPLNATFQIVPPGRRLKVPLQKSFEEILNSLCDFDFKCQFR